MQSKGLKIHSELYQTDLTMSFKFQSKIVGNQ